MGFQVSVSSINKIRKKYGLTKKDSLTANQFREACSIDISKSDKNRGAKNTSKDFTFSYHLDYFEDKGIITVKITGKHISKNVYDRLPKWGRGGQYAYKKSLETASRDCYLMQRSLFLELKKRGIIPIKKAKIGFVFKNPVSRDYDNQFQNVKLIQDTITRLGLIVDDKKENLEDDFFREVITDRSDLAYSILVSLKII